MTEMITQIEDYFSKGCGRCSRFDTPTCNALRWGDGQKALRRICQEAGLVETVKWGQPCYMHADRNICILGAFKDDFRLSFFNAALMKDTAGLLEKQGPNTQNPGMIRFTQNEQVAELADSITQYLLEAMGYADAGILPPKIKTELAWPDELVEALDADPAYAEAFHALTPGRQKSYILMINGAKKTETKIARIIKLRDKVFAGKGANEY